MFSVAITGSSELATAGCTIIEPIIIPIVKTNVFISITYHPSYGRAWDMLLMNFCQAFPTTFLIFLSFLKEINLSLIFNKIKQLKFVF